MIKNYTRFFEVVLALDLRVLDICHPYVVYFIKIVAFAFFRVRNSLEPFFAPLFFATKVRFKLPHHHFRKIQNWA